MAHLIDKDALVGELKKLKEENKPNSKSISEYVKGGIYGFDLAIEKTLSILNTLEVKEVKEVDLNEEIESYFKGFGKYPSVGIDDCIDIARHFFKFGLKSKEKRRSMGKHNCPYFSENAQVCDDGDCHHYECLRRIEKIKAQKKEENATK